MSQRQKYLDLWEYFSVGNQYAFCRYIRTYQKALTAFYQAQWGEAEVLFTMAAKEAKTANHPIGEVRCLYHQGLVYGRRKEFSKAKKTLTQCMFMAEDCSRIYTKRCTEELAKLGGRGKQQKIDCVHQLKVNMTEAMEIRNFKKARALYLMGRKEIKKLKLNQHSPNFNIYLPLIQKGLQKPIKSLEQSLFSEDKRQRTKYLELKEQFFGLNYNEISELEEVPKGRINH